MESNKKLNRRVTLELGVYDTEDSVGRVVIPFMKKDGTIYDQDLLLSLWDLNSKETEAYSNDVGVFYMAEFFDRVNIHKRMEDLADRRQGEHSRRSEFYMDNATFKITQRDNLIHYLEKKLGARQRIKKF